GGTHLALDAAALGEGDDRLGVFARDHPADHAALDVQPAVKVQVALQHDLRSDQRLDRAVDRHGLLILEHHTSPRDWGCIQASACSRLASGPRSWTFTRCGVKPSGSITLPSRRWK